MQSSDRVLAWRYGRALFEAAAGKKEDGKILGELQSAQAATRQLLPVLRNPRVSTVEKKKKIGASLEGKASPLVSRFLDLLIEKKRFELLPMVVVDLGKLVAEKNNTVKAVVRAAKPLSSETQQRLKDKLKNFSGKNVELEIKEDPEIIGGVIVRLGDWVLDSSLRGQLRKLKETINGN
jgi:F-type H+-transporting ATPase subunit delta